jgi:hypothetical protein
MADDCRRPITVAVRELLEVFRVSLRSFRVRRILTGGFLLAATCLVTLSGIAETPQSQGAKATREKKLTAKITVEFDNKPLREILDELPGILEGTGAGRVRIKPLPGSGITLTSRFTIKGKDITLEEFLNKLIVDKNWGWYVNSTKVGDQDDGAIFLTTNPKETGYKDGTGPKDMKDSKGDKKDTKKDDTKGKGKETEKEMPKDADAEKAAADLLSKGKLQAQLKQPEKAKKTFEEIIEKYPDTKGAAEAKKQLEKLPK